MRNVSEINVPSAKNSFLKETTTKEVDNNINNNINNSEINNCKNNTNESLKLSENNNKNEEKEENKKFTKSSTYNEQNNKSNNSFNNCILNDNDIINNNLIQLQKSRTCENEVFQRQSFTLGFNNINRNHLETVLETVSEVSNSKVDSSDVNKKKEETENNGKNETKETGKNKEE